MPRATITRLKKDSIVTLTKLKNKIVKRANNGDNN